MKISMTRSATTFVLLVICLTLLSSCKQESAEQESKVLATNSFTNAPSLLNRQETNVSIPAATQRQGDALAGARRLVSEPIVSCGLPLSALEQLGQNSEYTLSTRPGPAASLPYNLNLIEDHNGVQLAASNCLSCHAAPLFGELVIGLGNEFLDFTVNLSTAVERSGALVKGEAEIAAWEKFADRIAAIAPYIQTETVGVNPANNLTFALMAHRDEKTMQWLDEPRLPMPPTDVPPVSVPPWWRMKKKHAMFSMGEGRGDHASFMMTAAILCTDSIAELKALQEIGPDIRAYIASLEPPAYPFSIDDELVVQGKAIFEGTCSACHGKYGEQANYPNRLVDIDVIRTDPSLIDFAFGNGAVFVDWFNASPFGQLASAQPSRGYVAPPLDGIWSTAPFLHNGSVPTIRALLDSSSRPTVWSNRDQSSDSKASYNQADLGWHINKHSSDKGGAEDPWIYDTRKPGYANHGHAFGDALDNDQRDAVLEYLKTL